MKFCRLCHTIIVGHSNANSNMYNFNSGCSKFLRNGSTTTTTTTASNNTTMETTTTTRAKLVKNLSSIPLIEIQESLLARCSNTAIVRLYSPKYEYVTAFEKGYQNLNP